MRVILLLFCLTGCMPNNSLTTAGMASDNVANLPRLAVGMDQRQVLQIMHHPYSQETHRVRCDVYDVWFYVTRVTMLGQSRMVPLNLTPLTFKNGRLVGWGYDYYRYIFEQQKKKPAPKQPAPAKKEEDIKLEKALKKATSMSKPPPKEEPPLDEEDEKMIEEADEQNFDYW